MIEIDCSVLDDDIDSLYEYWQYDPRRAVERIVTDLVESETIDNTFKHLIYDKDGEYNLDNDMIVQRQVTKYIQDRIVGK